MEAAEITTSSMEWETLDGFPGELKGKILREDDDGGAKTILVHLLPGDKILPHLHPGTVQHLVITGSYEAGGNQYGLYNYRLMPPHADVETIKSNTGATILMIYDPVNA